MQADSQVDISFDEGSLRVACDGSLAEKFAACADFEFVRDARVGAWRTHAHSYRALIEFCLRERLRFDDRARNYSSVDFKVHEDIQPRTHQSDALAAWIQAGGRGYVEMPTGAGKTIFALLAMLKAQRPTLIHVPTLDLLEQWKSTLFRYFQVNVGTIGGGSYEICEITVTTYDSALRHVYQLGNRFGFVIFDECHHLPGELYRQSAICSLAPYRLGLSATPEREDVGEELLANIIGPCAYRISIGELEGSTLADYSVITCRVSLTPEEEQEYRSNRERYLSFVRWNRIDFGAQGAWQRFLQISSRSADGRLAFESYRRQREIFLNAQAKVDEVWRIVLRHAKERILIFTHDNAMAYRLGQLLVAPVLTHQTSLADRHAFLQGFRKAEWNVLVTSRVLNEGVDVPEASVGIVVSGTGTVREHVQRLGRILRAQDGKKAVLYEIVTAQTSEEMVSLRRRSHDAYQRPARISSREGQSLSELLESHEKPGFAGCADLSVNPQGVRGQDS